MRPVVLLLLALPARADVADLVWAAVDASEKDYPKAILALRRRTDWKTVARVLSRGRRVPARSFQAVEGARLPDVFRAVGWSRGRVRRYDFGDEPQAWYALRLPATYDGTPTPVLVNLAAPLKKPPEGWAVVVPNWSMIASMETAGIPMSMVAGADFQSLVLSILGDLERRFAADPDQTFLAGYSRAGNSTLYFGVHWPDRWAGIVVASGYYDAPKPVFGNLLNLPVLCASGVDSGHRASNEFTAQLAELAPHAKPLVCKPRAIDEPFAEQAWRWMGAQRRDPLPKRVRYTLFDPQHRGAYWVEIRKVKSTGGMRELKILAPGGHVKERVRLHRTAASVDAELRDSNEIRLKTRNVAELVVHLSPAMVDLDAPVRIRIGTRVIEHKPRPSINRLVAGYRENRDSRRLFPDRVLVSP